MVQRPPSDFFCHTRGSSPSDDRFCMHFYLPFERTRVTFLPPFLARCFAYSVPFPPDPRHLFSIRASRDSFSCA